MSRARASWLALALAVSVTAAATACSGDPSGDEATSEDEDALAAPSKFDNPILPLFDRPAGVSHDVPANTPHQASEGCPDPSALRTRSGDYYLYCTSYTFRFTRHDGFPIFKSRSKSLAGPWKRVGALVPDSGASRSSWPRWVRNQSGTRDGDFWGPDAQELPSGKFVASYSAPCGSSRCVGIAWADHPAGPWHHADAPYITHANNGVGSEDSYDPNLLVTSTGDLYFYWAVVGHGVYGAKVRAKASGELEPVAPGEAHVIADRTRGQRGEGPYVVEHGGAFYELYSTGSLLFDYHVGVRRGTSPLGRFDEEGPRAVVSRGGPFVATGGNSVVKMGGRDWLVYHAIVVPRGGGCPRKSPEYGGSVDKTPSNPHCRVQGERQAMIDPMTWKAGADGVEWPELENGHGTPSVGPTRVP